MVLELGFDGLFLVVLSDAEYKLLTPTEKTDYQRRLRYEVEEKLEDALAEIRFLKDVLHRLSDIVEGAKRG